MRNEFGKTGNEQRKMMEEMEAMESEAVRLRGELEGCEEKRRETMQNRAASLDQLVEQMLTEAKKLEVRVEGLRRGYEVETDKVRQK